MAISSKKALESAKVLLTFTTNRKGAKTVFLGCMAQTIGSVICMRLICKMF